MLQEYAGSPDQLSLAYFNDDEEPLGPDYIPPQGYQGVFKSLYSTLEQVGARGGGHTDQLGRCCCLRRAGDW